MTEVKCSKENREYGFRYPNTTFYHRGNEVDACDLNVSKRLGYQFLITNELGEFLFNVKLEKKNLWQNDI